MNIIQIIPGSGGSFYCGNCLRDSKMVVALREQGYNVTKLPMYLPLFADEHDLADIPVFYDTRAGNKRKGLIATEGYSLSYSYCRGCRHHIISIVL